MKTNFNHIQGTRKACSFCFVAVSFVCGVLFLIATQTHVLAQDTQYTKAAWWFGASEGANLNSYRGTTQKLNSDLTLPAAFHPGNGTGLYLGPLMEFHNPYSRWGVMMQAGFDSRRGKFEQVITPCNCPADLSANLGYITLEPSLRFAPFRSNLYLFAGPRIAFNVTKSFTYQLGTNPSYPNQEANPEVKGEFSDVNPNLLSAQIGAGYDFPLSPTTNKMQFVFSPFVSFHPYYGQAPRAVETWTVSTWRIGAAFKFGRGQIRDFVPTEKANVTSPEVWFTVNAPKNIPVERKVRETFPLRNYVFFNLGSTKIPERYVLLTKNQVKDFREDNLEVFKPKRISGRSERQMIVYYNVINIIGSRMEKNPAATITWSVLRKPGLRLDGQ